MTMALMPTGSTRRTLMEEGQRGPRRGRRQRFFVRAVTVLVLSLFAVWALLYITKGRFLRATFERVAASQLHRQVRVLGDFQLYFDPIELKFLADGVNISNPAYASRLLLLGARHIEMRIAPLSLFRAKWRMSSLEVAGAAIDLEWDAAHQHNSWTFGDDKKRGKPLTFPVIDRATLAGTTLRFRDPRLRLIADIGFDTIRSANAHIGSAVRFNGTGQVRATPFIASGGLLSPNETVQRGQNRLALHALANGNVIDMTAVLPSLAALEDVPLQLSARGANLAKLLKIIGVVVPETRAYALNTQLVLHGPDYRFTQLRGRFGDSDLLGAFTVFNADPRVRVSATLSTHSLDIVDAAPFIGYNPDVVAAHGAAAASGTGGARLLPDTSLQIEALRAFDAQLLWHVDAVRSRKVPLSDIDVTLALDHSLLKLTPLTFTMARGRVSSNILIDARAHPVHTDYDIRLLPTPLGRLLTGFGAIEAGTTGTIQGRVQLAGDGDSVHDSLSTSHGRIAFVLPTGTFWTRNVQLVELDLGVYLQRLLQEKLKQPVHINCGLIAFTVRNGSAATDPIVVDTTKNAITGQGGFSFRDERIDIGIRAHAKKFSLFSGQSPIGIGGSFAAPTIRPISPQLLARAGVGFGLTLLAPPAGLLAFIDPGLAKGAACGPVLEGAPAAAQRTKSGAPLRDVTRGRGGARKKLFGLF